MNEIKRCPNPECGLPCKVWDIHGEIWFVRCVPHEVDMDSHGCNYAGPAAKSSSEAIRLHNLIASPAQAGEAEVIAGEIDDYLRDITNFPGMNNEQYAHMRDLIRKHLTPARGEPVAWKQIYPYANAWRLRSMDLRRTEPDRADIYEICADELEAAFPFISTGLSRTPVAWLMKNAPDSEGNDIPYTNWSAVKVLIDKGYECVPLYAHPPLSVPVAELEKLAAGWKAYANQHWPGDSSDKLYETGMCNAHDDCSDELLALVNTHEKD